MTGVAFKDYNADGIQQGGEPGVEDITVKVYDSSDEYVTETTTDENGTYSLSIGEYPVRLAFILPTNSCSVKVGEDFPSAGADNMGVIFSL